MVVELISWNFETDAGCTREGEVHSRLLGEWWERMKSYASSL